MCVVSGPLQGDVGPRGFSGIEGPWGDSGERGEKAQAGDKGHFGLLVRIMERGICFCDVLFSA